ncbi:hypothetical protein QWY93_06125 [Echinicola jeungdonensis]|uniref:Uncharacterized protein n=1 Tax=Echinicola jeungdonensis TaxID=709343 RepID=A0ABV5J398_9BACT|nr:hypothetical protein [Echinicola jeungdonensis]MDN3668900.1 hypothetical protein [Echinicola jeungdonensis]
MEEIEFFVLEDALCKEGTQLFQVEIFSGNVNRLLFFFRLDCHFGGDKALEQALI